MSELRAAMWEGQDGASLRARWGVPALHLFHRVGSTNDVARRLAEQGAPAGSVVLADEQLRGRGRAGRAWASAPRLGVWMSVVLRPGPVEPGRVPLAVGVAAARALDRFVAPERVLVKWPNDLLLGGRKFAGILCEGAWQSGGPEWIVAGLGINVLHCAEHLPAEARASATSLALASGSRPERAEVAGAVASALLDLGPLLCGELGPALAARDALLGSDVVVLDPASGTLRERGTVLGIAPDGALRLRTVDGAERCVRSGTVRPAAAPVARDPRQAQEERRQQGPASRVERASEAPVGSPS